MQGVYRICVIVVLILGASGSAVFGQGVASLQGKVVDSSGGAVPGVTITATHIETNVHRSTITGDEGIFVFPSLTVGEYKIRAELAGFKVTELTGVILQVAQKASIDLTLEVGELSEQVNVTGQAPVLQTTQASVGQVVENRLITELPLKGRAFSDLAGTTPGAVRISSGLTFSSGDELSVDGSDVEKNEWTLDGTTVRRQGPRELAVGPRALGVRVSVDAIQEFKVETNSFSADKGRSGVAITTVTKSGTNEFHGNLFEFIRNDVLDARNFFAKEPPPLKQNQFGGSLGGPIVKNKLFFFFNYEGQRSRRGQTFNTVVPSAAARAGDFSGQRTIRDPFTKTPFSNNKIPASQISPTALGLLEYYPLPNTPAGTFVWSPTAQSDFDSYLARVDWSISDKDLLFYRHSFTDINSAEPNPFPRLSPAQLISANLQSGTLGYTRTLSSKLVNELRVAHLRPFEFFTSPLIGTDFHKRLGIKGFELTADRFPGPPVRMFISGVERWNHGISLPFDSTSQSTHLTDGFTYTRGSHTMTAGIDFRMNKELGANTTRGRGQFTFDGRYTGIALADFLLGFPSLVNRNSNRDRLGNFSWNWHYYFQDDWQVSPRLTLNLGLRYEYDPDPIALRGVKSLFDPNLQKFVVPTTKEGKIDLTAQSITPKVFELFKNDIVTNRDVGLNRSLLRSDRNDFAPRVGIAYRVASQTVLRVGYGLFHGLDHSNNRVIEGFSIPWEVSEDATGHPTTPDVTINDPYKGRSLGSVGVIPAIRTWDPSDRPSPYEHDWNLLIQHVLKPLDLSIEAGYLGKQGKKFMTSMSFNVPPPGPGPIQPRRPFPRFGAGGRMSNSGNSMHHAFQLRFVRRAQKGLLINGSYVFAKTIDDLGSGQDGGRLTGLSSLDVRHRFVTSYVYELPFARTLKGISGALLSGWQISGITTFQSGFPFTPAVAGNILNNGLAALPNRFGSGKLQKPTIQKWFKTEDFTVPQQFTYGTSGRNILQADGLANFDFGLFKNFAVRETCQVQFRAEFFNLFNHANFGPPDPTVNLATGGRVFSAGDPRIIQFGLKLTF